MPEPRDLRRFPAAVSLHSHTLYSRETLDFLPRFTSRVPLLRAELDRHAARYRAEHGRDLDFTRVWWTPPLSPRAAYELEAGAIAGLGMKPLVSLTDHDDIEAPVQLGGTVPVSFEWSVRFESSVFHIGLHNLPRPRAAEMFRRLTLFDGALADLLAWVSSFPGTLVVLNHPYCNESGAPAEWHEAALYGLLAGHKRWIHALELNGLRPWAENRRTQELARALAMPVVSGGDRHGAEPNACLNLTRASTFAGFVEEVRRGVSEVWFRDHY